MQYKLCKHIYTLKRNADDVTTCLPQTNVDLMATGTGGALNWYESNSSSDILYTGDTYAVAIQQTTSFFVSENNSPSTVQVGPANNDIGDGC